MSGPQARVERPPVTVARLVRWAGLLLAALLIAGAVCSLVGHYRIQQEWSWRVWDWPLWSSQVWHVRVLRLAAAALVGAGLASAGMATQALLRNPLAEPYLLGLSSGAGVGVLAGMAASDWIGIPEWCTTPILALCGSLAAMLAVYLVAQRRGRIDPLVLLLSGVIINVFNGALILIVLQAVKREQMIQFVGWSMGQVPEWLWFRPSILVLSACVVLAGWVHLFLRSAAFNAMGLGDDVAASSGVAVHRLRIEAFFTVSLMTAAAVALAGPIGFVGLIVPHICRLIVGPDHRLLVIVCALGGALFLMVADTSCRRLGEWMAIGELPVGIVTALAGGPFFIWLLRRKLRGDQP